MHELNNKWVLWFHHIDDNNWDELSYQRLCEMNTIEEFWNVYNMIETFTAGMFFLMKEDIFPRWEDINNLEGGYWAFRISKKDTDKLWEYLSVATIGNILTKDGKMMDEINGISVSPKINNCILKIWNKDASINSVDILNNIIEGLEPNNTIYRRHQDQVDFNVIKQ